MPLIEPIKALCAKLAADPGWKALFAAHKLDIGAADIATKLNNPLTVDRTLLGFGDFADDGIRAIEPGSPARSLLYHALASPNVLNAPDGTPLTLFPTPAELDAVENYIFGVRRPTLAEVQARFPGKPLAVVVFACEYRPASQTTHGRHADLTFARTGVARVGTRAPRYVPEFRGFHPEVPAEPFGIAVSPARYVAYLAVQLPGSAADVQLMRPRPRDDGRLFWVPVHKLFPGDECLNGLTKLTVKFQAAHVNEKIFRAQKLLGNSPPNSPPFRFTTDLADLSTDPTHGPGWIVPTVHSHLVAEAKTDVQFDVPKTKNLPRPRGPGNWATVDLWAIFPDQQSAPEYLYARTEVLANGIQVDLNLSNAPPVDERVRLGNYRALHYVDFTADGAVGVACPQVQGVGGVAADALPAYSLVAAPDFFPSCDQRELTEWVESNAVPEKLKDQIWAANPPTPLSDQRFPANLQMPSSPFQGDDKTVSAIVALPIAPTHSPVQGTPPALRHSHLPDDAAGVFFPGWDVSLDSLAGVDHLAAYGLGSPFPEDSKLCAALSSFWPAVAPDVTRTMDTAPQANLSGTVAPLTDAEIGRVGGLPWDGVTGPEEIVIAGQAVAEYNSFVHADYVRNALADRFTLRLTSKVDFREYADRILAMAYGYIALGVERTSDAQNPALTALAKERKEWIVLSFATMAAGEPELTKAGFDTGTSPSGMIYRATVFRTKDKAGKIIPFTTPADFRKRRILITGRVELILAPANPPPTGPLVLLKTPNEMKWRRGRVIVV